MTKKNDKIESSKAKAEKKEKAVKGSSDHRPFTKSSVKSLADVSTIFGQQRSRAMNTLKSKKLVAAGLAAALVGVIGFISVSLSSSSEPRVEDKVTLSSPVTPAAADTATAIPAAVPPHKAQMKGQKPSSHQAKPSKASKASKKKSTQLATKAKVKHSVMKMSAKPHLKTKVEASKAKQDRKSKRILAAKGED